MTPAQFELARILIKGIVKLGERLDKVGQMTDQECREAIPLVQTNIDKNDQTIQEL